MYQEEIAKLSTPKKSIISIPCHKDVVVVTPENDIKTPSINPTCSYNVRT